MTDAPSSAAAPLALDDRLRTVGEAIRMGDMGRAVALAREGLDLGQEHAGLLGLRSLWFEQQNQYEAALLDLDRALEIAPGDPATLNAKGLVLDKLQRTRDAAVAFRAATVAAPRFAHAFHNLGWASEMTGELGQARNAYEQALALKPDYVEPLAHLAGLALRRGDANSARVHAEQALRIDPDFAPALTACAEADLEEGDPAAAEPRLRVVVAGARATPLDRGVAQKLLGDALNAQGRYDEAFAAYAEGNRELQALYAPRFAVGRSQTAPEMLLWLINYMQATTTEVWAPRPAAPPAPDAPLAHLFTTGFPRSGSDFLENALNADASTALLRGRDSLGESVRDFMADSEDLDYLARAGETELEPYRRAYWRRVREGGVEPMGKLFVDRLPLNAMRAPVIARLFPGAATIFTVRDPRDVVLSCFRGRLQMNPTMYEFLSLDGAARIFDLMMRLTLLYREKLPSRRGLIRYEDLVDKPEEQLAAACGFIGVPCTAEMRAFAAVENAKATANPEQRGYYGETVDHWRRYAAHLEPVAQILAPWVKLFGYPAA
ncbi:MAG TPA: sulfotransferase [Caulobacteraceae bacterium]|jgi:tetratricopeptide (TPR) repeat protein|nr:sulfotransferase [Caulobacteraceae bacterium]